MNLFKWAAVITCMVLLGCGGSAVRIDGELDSPSQHVITGNQLLEVGKLDGALREFNRSLELDPKYIPAYVGLSDTYGAMGQFNNGLEYLSEAERLAQSAEDKALVKQGIERLRKVMEESATKQAQ
jgi:tetratricopeptide (TPR) repeat protein